MSLTSISPEGSAERSAQAPTVGGRSKRLLGGMHWTGAFWYRLHSFGVRILPEAVLPLMTRLFALIFVVVLGGVRRGIASNLETVLGPAGRVAGWRRSFRTLLQHAWCMNESYEGLQGGGRSEPEVEGVEHWRAVTDAGRGFVLVTAHVGHWQVGSHLTEQGKVSKIHVVREQELDPEAQRFMAEMLRRSGGESYEVHFSGGDDPALGTRLLKALRAGEVVALQGDRASAQGRRLSVELFGRPFEVPAGPAALARAAEVPMLPVFVFRSGRASSRLSFRPPIEVDPERPSRVATHEAMQSYVQELEWAVRREPHQWFCLRALWPAKGTAKETK
ncbi:MAG: lysophospholipid acyltransferase family protein [Acidobacteriota bacterium]